MKFFSKVINTSILYTLVTTVAKSYAADNVNILVEKPNTKISQEEYSTKINEYFKAQNNSTSTTPQINFTYLNDNNNENIDYKKYLKLIVDELKTSKYDMLILDDFFLFSDTAFVESSYIEDTFQNRNMYQNYMDLTKYVVEDDLFNHDQKYLDNVYFDEKLYGLPYELDFDLLYHQNGINVNMENSTWDDLVPNSEKGEQNQLDVALRDDDELLNLFTAYANDKYNIENNKEEFYKVLYNDTSKELYNSFRNLVEQSSLSDLGKTLNITPDEAYNDFINGQSAIYKGKASNYRNLIQNNTNIKATLPPFNSTVVNKKYLVINKNSKVDKNVLVDVARKLTSKDMQIYRSREFGSIPTFEIHQTELDSFVGSYCDSNVELCDLMQNINPLNIKDIYESEFNAPFLETKLLLPNIIRQSLIDNKQGSSANAFENVRNLVVDKNKASINFSVILLYIITAILVIGALAVIVMLIKYRNHSSLKKYSPLFYIPIILGIIMNILSPIFIIHLDSIFSCKFRYIYETVNTCLIILPMAAIAIRTYYRTNNKGKKLNKRLILIIVIATAVMVLYSVIVTLFIIKFYLQSYGNIESFRFSSCKYENGIVFDIFERVIYCLIVSVILILILIFYILLKKEDV